MSYKYSHVDLSNLKWFQNDNTCQTLRKIELRRGELRGLKKLEIDFAYPITVISGVNGSGKSTLLAMASCAFHNKDPLGFQFIDRKKPYYTFSDFFIQSNDEISPAGIIIGYGIMHDHWKKIPAGIGWQFRVKSEEGKWSNYNRRVSRDVAFLGIQRVVPDSEKTTHISYRKLFSPVTHQHSTEICRIASKILGKKYSKLDTCKIKKYILHAVDVEGLRYSGFNMGAGERAVFSLLSTIFEVGRGGLIVIDEIELGLHALAQDKLIEELKILCKDRHCQIICSTHSRNILDSVPPEARFLIRNYGDHTDVLAGVTGQYASSKLSGKNSGEIEIYCEDTVAEPILRAILSQEIRERVHVVTIGSSELVLRQVVAYYKRRKVSGTKDVIAVLDGDKYSTHLTQIAHFIKYLESKPADTEEISKWFDKRLLYLPGKEWPEKMLLEKVLASKKTLQHLESQWQAEDIGGVVNRGILAGKHCEFYVMGEELHIDEKNVLNDVISGLQMNTNLFAALALMISERVSRLR